MRKASRDALELGGAATMAVEHGSTDWTKCGNHCPNRTSNGSLRKFILRDESLTSEFPGHRLNSQSNAAPESRAPFLMAAPPAAQCPDRVTFPSLRKYQPVKKILDTVLIMPPIEPTTLTSATIVDIANALLSFSQNANSMGMAHLNANFIPQNGHGPYYHNYPRPHFPQNMIAQNAYGLGLAHGMHPNFNSYNGYMPNLVHNFPVAAMQQNARLQPAHTFSPMQIARPLQNNYMPQYLPYQPRPPMHQNVLMQNGHGQILPQNVHMSHSLLNNLSQYPMRNFPMPQNGHYVQRSHDLPVPRHANIDKVSHRVLDFPTEVDSGNLLIKEEPILDLTLDRPLNQTTTKTKTRSPLRAVTVVDRSKPILSCFDHNETVTLANQVVAEASEKTSTSPGINGGSNSSKGLTSSIPQNPHEIFHNKIRSIVLAVSKDLIYGPSKMTVPEVKREWEIVILKMRARGLLKDNADSDKENKEEVICPQPLSSRQAPFKKPTVKKAKNETSKIFGLIIRAEDKASWERKGEPLKLAGPANIKLVPIGLGYAKVPEKLLDCMNWANPSQCTRKLLTALFPRSVLATHSLSGKPAPAFPDKPVKKMLDPNIVDDIVQTVMENCAVSEKRVRMSITIKCADECKMLRMRQAK